MCFSPWLLSSKSSNITRSFHRILYETISWHTWARRLHKRKIPKNQYPFEKKMMLSLTPCGIWQPGIHTNLIRLLKVHRFFPSPNIFSYLNILVFWNREGKANPPPRCNLLAKQLDWTEKLGQENRKVCLPKFLRLWKNNCVSRKSCKRRSDLALNGQMRVSK